MIKLFEKIKIKTKNGKSKILYLFGIPILKVDTINNQKQCKFILFHQNKFNNDKPVMYLKANSLKNFSMLALKNWINIAVALNYDYIIICDNPKFKSKLYNNIVFPNSNVTIINSIRNKKVKSLAKHIANKTWLNAAMAHLTTFYHAKQNGIKSFWNIDADDTTFLIECTKLADIFKTIENYTDKNNIPNISLDMWKSWTKGAHWSFGINYVNNKYNWFKIIDDNKKDWLKVLYSKYHPSMYNIDWYFTYLSEFRHIPMKSFYIENCKFIHWDDFVCRRNYANLCHWKDGFLYYPVLYDLFKDEKGRIPIAQDCIKFDCNLTDEEGNNFYNKLIPDSKPNI